MTKVSTIISSYVVSLYNGQTEGVVDNILFNNKKQMKYLIINKNDEEFLLLNTKDIYAIGDGAVIIKNSEVLSLLENKNLELTDYFSPINNIVVNLDGNYLGYANDIELDNNYTISQIKVNNKLTISTMDIVKVTNSAILTCIGVKKPKISTFKAKNKIPQNIPNTLVTIENKKNETIIPYRSITNYNFLLNRKVTKNINNYNGEIIIKENQYINSKILDIARMNGKIRELTKYSI